ncbi:lysozyme [Henriciella pelagia]|uniref:lysozyme n=1 Tax=Henriciella pelagia TaxID=1977912 RepID=UPI0035169244
MRFGPYFSLLNAEFENDAGRLVTEAYLDPVGIWTGPFGITRNGDGSPVREGQKWSEAEALQIYADQKSAFAADVWSLIDEKVRPLLKQHQFDGLGRLAWNIGIGAFADSTVLRKVNEARFEEAASAFLLYFRATLRGGRKGPDGNPARDPNGQVLPEGVDWFKAMRGILRSSASAALLFSGRNWRDAAAPNKIILNSVPVWTGKRWYDEVKVKSEWKDILADAQDDPLPLIHGTEPMNEEPPMPETVNVHGGRTLTLPANWDSMTPNQQTAWLNGEQTAALQKDAITQARVLGRPGNKPLSVNTKRVEEVPYGVEDPAVVGAAPMEETGRGKSMVIVEKAKSGVNWGAAVGAASTGAGAYVGLTDNATKAGEATGGLAAMFAEHWQSIVIMGLCVSAVIVGYNLVMWQWGRIKRFRAEQQATQLMY